MRCAKARQVETEHHQDRGRGARRRRWTERRAMLPSPPRPPSTHGAASRHGGASTSCEMHAAGDVIGTARRLRSSPPVTSTPCHRIFTPPGEEEGRRRHGHEPRTESCRRLARPRTDGRDPTPRPRHVPPPGIMRCGGALFPLLAPVVPHGFSPSPESRFSFSKSFFLGLAWLFQP